jgi:hypothetical protein
MALPAARAMRSYCTGFSHRPVSAPIPNAEVPFCHAERSEASNRRHAISLCKVR